MKKLGIIVGIVAAAASLVGAAKAVFVIPYKLDVHDLAISELRAADVKIISDMQMNHELLVRIEERLKEVQYQLGKASR